jgi:hypothetical protein
VTENLKPQLQEKKGKLLGKEGWLGLGDFVSFWEELSEMKVN